MDRIEHLAILLQLRDGTWRPMGFVSHSLIDTERRYTSIEKETLAITWRYKRFLEFLLGKQIHLESGHKSLIITF